MTPTTYQALHDVAREWASDMNARANAADAARVERVADIRRALDAIMAGEGPPGALTRAEAAWEAEQASAVREGDAFFAEGFAIGLVLQGAYRAALGHALAMLSRGRALRLPRLDAARRAAEVMAAAEPAKSAEEVKAARVEGGKKGGRGNRKPPATSAEGLEKPKGDSSARLAARLKRDHPEIAAAVERGEKKDRRVTACFACVFQRMGSVHAFFDLHGEHASPHLVARHEAHAF